ncbi:MAG: DUF4097 family beta strand repeat-containing protein [Thermoanaerobaculia bacterium]
MSRLKPASASRTVRRFARFAMPQVLCLIGLLAAAVPARAADAQRQIDRATPATGKLTIELHNLAGNVTVVAASSDQARVSGTVHAAATSSTEAERIAGKLDVTFEQVGDKWLVKAVYPLDETRKYVFPRRSEEESLPWFLAWLDLGNSNFKYEGRDVHVYSQPTSGALTLYADFRVEVPAGVAVTIKNGVGMVQSTGVHGTQLLDISTGEIAAEQGEGKLTADSGSGDVVIRHHNGDVSVDTGSGDVKLEAVVGDKIDIDTGSGDIDLSEVTGSLDTDTGSGDIRGRDLHLGTALRADTGSGDVSFSGDLSALTKIDIDTGSGDVLLESNPASAVPQVRMEVGTGSGGISVDMPTSRITHTSHGDVTAEIGSATGKASISTGSGDVDLRAIHGGR